MSFGQWLVLIEALALASIPFYLIKKGTTVPIVLLLLSAILLVWRGFNEASKKGSLQPLELTSVEATFVVLIPLTVCSIFCFLMWRSLFKD